MDKKRRWHIHSAAGFSCKEEGNDDTRVKLGDPGDYVKQIAQISLDSLPPASPLVCRGSGHERRRGLRSKGMGEQEQKKN